MGESFAAESAWSGACPPGVLRLLMLFQLAPEPWAGIARQQQPALAAGRPEALSQALRKPTVALIRDAAQALADGLGCTAEEVLRFCDPTAAAHQLQGTYATFTRLDRLWGGAPLAQFSAAGPLVVTWPAPVIGRVIALHGKVQVNGRDLAPGQYLPVAVGDRLGMDTGALALLRRTTVALLLETALGAGFRDVVEACCAADLELEVGGIRLHLGERLVTVNGRSVRLTALENRAMEILARHPGEVQARALMMDRLGLTNARALDRLVLSLRDKLGDGLIATIYGSGYALECLDKEPAR